jgi:hypothetical protein
MVKSSPHVVDIFETVHAANPQVAFRSCHGNCLLMVLLATAVGQAVAPALRAGAARGTQTWALLINISPGFGMSEVPGRDRILVGPQSKPLSLRLLFGLFIQPAIGG